MILCNIFHVWYEYFQTEDSFKEMEIARSRPGGIYRPRKPQESQYYQCVEDNFEMLEQVYDDRFTIPLGAGLRSPLGGRQ